MVGFKYGNFVRLHGLNNAAYAGKLAIIKSISADENAGRYLVEVVVGEVIASTLSREILVEPENMVRACDGCHLAGAATMQYCGRCKNAAYCNAECQRNDWKRHKVDCREMNCQRQIMKSPLHLAATVGNLAEVQNLVRAGADANNATKKEGCSPLYLAAQRGHLEVVRYLIDKGAEKDKATNDGAFPLWVAASNGHLEVAQYLVCVAGSGLQQGEERWCYPPLHSCSSRSFDGGAVSG
jgi:hypothetical protein